MLQTGRLLPQKRVEALGKHSWQGLQRVSYLGFWDLGQAWHGMECPETQCSGTAPFQLLTRGMGEAHRVRVGCHLEMGETGWSVLRCQYGNLPA